MSIKSITIENFKGIREPVKFELAPITLLYGPNSAGKSTLLQALAYLNDVIVHDECNNEYTRAGGESMYLGNFADIVNGHDTSKSIKFSVELESIVDGSYTFHGWNTLQFPQKDLEGMPIIRNTIADGINVEFIISWDINKKGAFISCCKFIAKDIDLLTINAQEYKGNSTIKINFEHPYFLMSDKRHIVRDDPDNDYGWKTIFDCILNENSLLISNVTDPFPFKKEGIFEWGYFFHETSTWAHPDHMRTYFNQIENIQEQVQKIKDGTREGRIYFIDGGGDESEFEKTDIGAKSMQTIRELRKPINEISPRNAYINEAFRNYFNTLISGSFGTISGLLKDVIYIGPLRKRPDSETIQQNNAGKSWHDGMAAWQLLNNDRWGDLEYKPSECISKVNQYLGGSQYFNSGYHIKTGKVLSLELELAGEIQKLFEQDDGVDLAELKKQLNQHSHFKRILKLRDLGREVDVDLTAVGTGISQIVPIISALVLDDVNVIMIEQPELHIHPRMQVQLGELLVHSLMSKRGINKQQKLHFIETHSEALLLRLMRRMREQSAEGHKLTPSDLAIYYVDAADGATRVSERIKLDEEGDFIDEWPGIDGFFEESFNENFGGR